MKNCFLDGFLCQNVLHVLHVHACIYILCSYMLFLRNIKSTSYCPFFWVILIRQCGNLSIVRVLLIFSNLKKQGTIYINEYHPNFILSISQKKLCSLDIKNKTVSANASSSLNLNNSKLYYRIKKTVTVTCPNGNTQ